MPYGIEVFNGSGRTIFSTEELNPNYYSSAGPISVNGYSVNPSYTIGSNTILLARPQDGESGAIFYKPLTGVFGGSPVDEQYFGAANGVKYVKFDPQSGITRGTTGYALEVFNTSGSLLFTSNTTYSFNILAVGYVTGVMDTTFTCPAGVNFNNVYITAISCTGELFFSQGVPPWSPDVWTYFGSLAYFNNSTGVITFRQVNIISGVVMPTWNSSSNYYAGTNSRKDYMIVEVKS